MAEERYTALKLILERVHALQISDTEAKEVGDTLVRFFELLAVSEAGHGQES